LQATRPYISYKKGAQSPFQFVQRDLGLGLVLNFYKFVKMIGKGAFGKVTLGIHKLTGKQVAIKTIEKNYM